MEKEKTENLKRNYQVLYRKWRSQTFSEIYGQPLIVAALKNEVKNSRFAHAYLFTGSRGTGKTSCAKILAKAVNCLNPADGDPCNKCDNCIGINEETILDVTEIDAASNNGVDSIRELREEVNFAPSVAKYRVYIIDEVHMLSTGAFNALLKTLEEPPAHVIFVLATTEVHKLPATILSRCQRYDFKRITPSEISRRIHFIAEQEGFSVTDEAALLLARLADGGMRDALSMLDQCISRGGEVDEDVVISVTGMAGREYLKKLSEAVLSKESGSALKIVNELHEDSKDMARLCAEWLEFYRNLMIIKSVPNPEDLVMLPAAELAELRELASRYNITEITHAMDVLQDAAERIKYGVSRRIEMELAVVKLCSPQLDSNSTALLRRMETIERAIKSGTAAAGAVSVGLANAETAKNAVPPTAKNSSNPTISTDNLAPLEDVPLFERPEEAEGGQAAAPVSRNFGAADGAEKNQAGVSLGDDDNDEVQFLEWANVMEVLSTACPPLYGVLEDATAVVRGTHILIETDNPMFKVLVSNDANRKILTQAVCDVAGRAYRIGVKKKPEQKKDETDPLSEFIRNSKDLGIEINID